MQSTDPDKAHTLVALNAEGEPLAASAKPVQPAPTADTALHSASLLRGHKTVIIEHNGTAYRLQSTRAGKLILTK